MDLTADLDKQRECVTEAIGWLHQVWELTDNGRPLQPDPFYSRNELLTPVVVKNVIESVEAIFKTELQKYMGYHRNAQGVSTSEILVPPGFDTLTYAQQFAVVQGIDRIFQKYRLDQSIA